MINSFDYGKPFYKYRTVEKALEMLQNKAFWYAKPSSFNDPFDCASGLLSYNIDNRFLSAAVDNLISRHPEVSDKRNTMLSNTTLESMQKVVLEQIENFRNNIGVFSVTEINNCSLMWAHYADCHTGVCLGFAIPSEHEQDIITRKMNAVLVNYVDEIEPSLFFGDELSIRKEALEYWLTTKAKCWEYEKEIRLLDLKGFGAKEFRPEWLVEIYFGIKCNKDSITQLQKYISQYYPWCKWFQMQFAPNSFSLIPQKL